MADNAWFHGLYVCPDIDIITYTLAGIADEERGWGIAGDTFRALDQLKRLGSPGTWFNIGDLDLATHVFRTSLLKEGLTLTEVTARVARGLGVRDCKILPASDQHVETRIDTKEGGEMHLQEFWVKEGGLPTPTAVRYQGARQARPTPEVLKSLAVAGRVVIAPGNPVTSIMPSLSVGGFRRALEESRARKVAISPMVGTRAFSGPAARLMQSQGIEPTSVGVARLYKGAIDAIIVDESDRQMAPSIERLGLSCQVAPTLMRSPADATRLARMALEI